MSSRKFYRLIADPAATSRWYLKSPIDPSGNEVDPRLFTQGVPVKNSDSQDFRSIAARLAEAV
jgi:hypothetical protein